MKVLRNDGCLNTFGQTTHCRRQLSKLTNRIRQNEAIHASVSPLSTTNSESTKLSPRSQVSRFAEHVRSIYVDFDDTISDGLTVALQLKSVTQGAARLLDQEDKAKKFAKERVGLITKMTAEYEREAVELIEDILQNYSTIPFDRNAIDEVMKLCGEFDDKWVKKVISNNVFGGVTRDDFLSLAPKTPLREEALSTLSSFKDSGIDISILSVNWSAEWIQAAVGNESYVITNGNHGPRGNLNIYCNEMVYGDDGISTGDVTRVMWSGQEKAKLLKQLLQAQQDPTEGGLSLFIGDSYYDIQPLLMVDIGIIIGDNKDILRFAEAFGIQTQQLLECALKKPSTADSPVLYTAKSWTEIANFIQSREINKSIESFN